MKKGKTFQRYDVISMRINDLWKSMQAKNALIFQLSASEPASAQDAAMEQWNASRQFIAQLITLCGADLNAQTKPKRFKAGEKIPEEKAKQYLPGRKHFFLYIAF